LRRPHFIVNGYVERVAGIRNVIEVRKFGADRARRRVSQQPFRRGVEMNDTALFVQMNQGVGDDAGYGLEQVYVRR
jgi:hypothetical protein